MPISLSKPSTINEALEVIDLQRQAITALARACGAVVISENNKASAARLDGKKHQRSAQARQCRNALKTVEALAQLEASDPRQADLFGRAARADS
jgi:hypothetical protein